MKANIFLDLEGTIIDDLESCTFLENNCNKIKRFIERLPIKDKTISLFTWGWLERKNVLDRKKTDSSFNPFIKNIEKKLGIKIYDILVKEDSLRKHAGEKGIKCNLLEYEMEMHDAGFNKEQSFIEMFKDISSRNPFILIDDSIEFTKTINFFDNKYFIEVVPAFPNISLINPRSI